MKACIFDLDGTLLDSMDIWQKIDVDFLTMRGLDMPDDYTDAVFALSLPEAAVYTIERFGLPDSVDDLIQQWKGMAIYAYGNTIQLKPHARDYLTALKQRGARLGIATSLPATLYEPVLHNHGITELFDVICTTDEVAYGKTRPDVFLLAAQRLGVPPGECVVFEDILPAIQCAKQIGMKAYAVYDPSSAEQWPQIELTADGVIYDFRDAPLP